MSYTIYEYYFKEKGREPRISEPQLTRTSPNFTREYPLVTIVATSFIFWRSAKDYKEVLEG